MEEITLQSIWEKLIVVETTLNNHLASQDKLLKWFLAPILVGTIVIVVNMMLGG